MARFFVDKDQITEKSIYIHGEDVKHISKVLRLRKGDEITVCDKEKMDYICELSAIESDKVVAEIKEKALNSAESDIVITLYQGIPKSDKMDYIIQKCVELGVCRFVPVLTKRAVSRPNDCEKKVSRWQKIAEEAAKQSGRGIVPVVGGMVGFDEALAEMTADKEALNLMPYECERDSKLRKAISGYKGSRINIFIGPEGGFDDGEALLARANGIKTITLGPRIMRTETAPLAACTAVMYELGDW